MSERRTPGPDIIDLLVELYQKDPRARLDGSIAIPKYAEARLTADMLRKAGFKEPYVLSSADGKTTYLPYQDNRGLIFFVINDIPHFLSEQSASVLMQDPKAAEFAFSSIQALLTNPDARRQFFSTSNVGRLKSGFFNDYHVSSTEIFGVVVPTLKKK